MNYKNLTAKLLDKCLKYGADEAEVYLQSTRNLSIQVLNGEIETVEEASSHGVGFRVFVDNKMGFSHCNDFSNSAVENTIKRAIAFAKLTSPDENNILTDNMGISEVEGLFDPAIAGVSMEEKIDMALKLEKMAMSDHRISKSSGSGFSESETEVFIANSHGLSKSYKSGGCGIGVSVVAEKGEQKNTGGEYCSRRQFSDLKKLEELAAKASRDAYEMLDPKMVRTQRAAVIVDPDVARSILGGVIGALNGERVLQGASFLKDSMDQKIASDLLAIIDDGTKEKGMASAPFDGEGVPTMKNTLIENGVLKSFIYNTSAAKRAGTESTGNASRRGFTSLPGIGTHNIYLLPGKHTRNEIIASTDRGLLLKGLTGYGINSVNGNFSGGASGFWIEKGKILYPVKGLTIAGKASDILNDIDMMGTDIDMNDTFASPTFRVSEMLIGGA
ncbi:MAG: TldD/PmbA family protein [Bacteroidales bacterium]|jgi:PmbA protein|nr:TldD/PmbA family protein [Bacteroidales bacterium]